MIGLIIGASEEAVHAIKVGQKQGLEIWAFDNNPNAKGLEYADKAFVCDINDVNNIIRIIGDNKPEVIIPIPIGRALVSTGKLNDYWNLLGVTEKSANLLTDKYEFHNVLHSNKLRNIECHLINKESRIKDMNLKSFPYILKPRYGSGSRNVYKLNNINDLYHAWCSIAHDEDYVLEEAFEGEEYGIDGIFDDNSFNLVLVRKKIITAPPAQQCVAYYSCDNECLNQLVIKQFEQISDFIKLKDCIIHADIMFNGDEIFVIEISARPSGHYLHNIFTPYVTGIDPVCEFIKKCLGGSYSYMPRFNRKSMIRFFDFVGEKILRIPSERELNEYGVVEYQIKFNIGDSFLDEIKDGSLTKRGFYIIDMNKNDDTNISEKILGLFIHDNI